MRPIILSLQNGQKGQLAEVIRIFLVDDQPAVRRGLRMRLELEPDLLVLGEAGDGESALPMIGATKPDVVLMDLAMPKLDGIAATAALRTLAPESAIVILSLNGDPAARARAQAAGAAAFVEKQAGEGALLTVIRSVRGRHQSESWEGDNVPNE